MEALWATILFSGFALEVIIRQIKKFIFVKNENRNTEQLALVIEVRGKRETKEAKDGRRQRVGL